MHKEILLAVIFIALFSFCAFAVQNQTTATYVVGNTSSLALSFSSSSRCLNSNNSSLDINVTVVKLPNNTLDPDANVTATVFKPDSDTNNVSFANNEDGNYSLTYFFDANGTYRFQVHAVDGSGTGDINAFVHVGSVGMRVSFVNNGETYTSGTTQTLTTSVVNTDGNIFEGISGTISI